MKMIEAKKDNFKVIFNIEKLYSARTICRLY